MYHCLGHRHPSSVGLVGITAPPPATQLPANVRPERQRAVTQVLGHLPPMWKTQTELLAPGFGLAQSWLLWALQLKTTQTHGLHKNKLMF